MKKIFLAFFAFVSFGSLRANAQQVVTTVAGTGSVGYSGDNGPAVLAAFNVPKYLKADGLGNYYITDELNNVVRKIDAYGIITTIAGNGTAGFSGDGSAATAAKLNAPSGIAFDASGNIYISDKNNNRVRKVNAAGTISTYAGTGAVGSGGDGAAATAATFNHPYGLATDTAGNLYIADVNNHHIRKVSTTGIVTNFAGTGAAAFGGDGAAATAASLNYPQCIYVSPAGDLYINDQQNRRIRKVTPAGMISTVAGSGVLGFSGDGGLATSAQVNAMGDITMDAAGTLYFSDDLNQRIRTVTAGGIINTFAGTGTAGHAGDHGPAIAAEFSQPSGITMGCNGAFLIAEMDNFDIRRIGPANEHPHFITPSDTLLTCVATVPNSLDTLLGVQDTDACQGLSWTILLPAAHGIVSGLPARTMSTGGTTYPLGLSYAPVVGFAGIDSFTVVVFDGVDTSMRKIYVNATPCPNAVTNVAGVQQAMTIMPNPSRGTFSINITSADAFTGEGVVTNMMGQKIASFAVSANKDNDINLTAPSGVYFVTVNTPQGSMTQKILIVQ